MKKSKPRVKAKRRARPKRPGPTAANKRVNIAIDAINQIQAGRLVVEAANRYVSIDTVCRLKPDTTVRLALRGKRCTVCQLGAAFVAAVDRFGTVTIGEVGLDGESEITLEGVDRVLSRFFSVAQQRSMEAAFENDLDQPPDPTDRALAIFRNIIRNGGTFKS